MQEMYIERKEKETKNGFPMGIYKMAQLRIQLSTAEALTLCGYSSNLCTVICELFHSIFFCPTRVTFVFIRSLFF